jgi:hypothetical protein
MMARKGEGNEMYKDLFKGVSTTTIPIPVLLEELEKAKVLFADNKWSEEEGTQIIFANGLAALQGMARLQEVSGTDGAFGSELERLTRELMDMQSKYAVMKFRAFTLDQAKQALEMNVTGLQVENRASGSRIWKFRADEEMLKGELHQLKAENERLGREIAVLRGEAEPEPDRRGVFRRILDAVWGRPAR